MVDLVPATVTIQTFYIDSNNVPESAFEIFCVPGVKACITRYNETYYKIVLRSQFIIYDYYQYEDNSCNKKITKNALKIICKYGSCYSIDKKQLLLDRYDTFRFQSLHCIIIKSHRTSDINITAIKLYDDNQYITCNKITCKKHPINPYYKLCIIDLSNINLVNPFNIKMEIIGVNIPEILQYSIYYIQNPYVG